MPVVGDEQPAGGEDAFRQLGEVRQLRQEVLAVGRVGQDQVHRPRCDPGDFFEPLERAVVEPDVAVAGRATSRPLHGLRPLLATRPPLGEPKLQVPIGCIVAEDLEGLLGSLRLPGGVRHDPW